MNLYNGDCLQILKDISSNSVDLVICDLPFGCLTSPRACKGPGWRKVEEETGEKAKIIRQSKDTCKWDVPIDLEIFWKEIKRIRKDDHTPCLHFCTTRYGYELIKSNEKEFRYDLVWGKPNAVGFLSANKMPMRSHEMIYVFSKAGANYKRIDLSGETPDEGNRCVKSLIYCSNKKTKGGHPTAKPIDLYKFLIERYCPIGGTVLDPTFGSGNSGSAAKELGRKYIGIEKDKDFFDKAKKILIEE